MSRIVTRKTGTETRTRKRALPERSLAVEAPKALALAMADALEDILRSEITRAA